MADDFDNPRDVELSSLSAIYPEIQNPDPHDPYTIALDVPVNPSQAVTVFFPAASDDASPPGASGAGTAGPREQGPVDSHELAHLPSIHLEISLGPRYPVAEPPQITISANPPWLPAETVKRLEEDAPRLWQEMGCDMVGFTYIDHVQQAADDVFGLVSDKGALEVDPKHKIAILDYDIKARRAAFEKGTFGCEICLEPKKGSVCHRMLDCAHVFCVACLQDFYNNAIKEGDIAAVRCLAPNCAKERGKAMSPGRKRKKPRTFINPSELLQIPLDQEVVKRYVTLKYKTELESDKNTIYCPRPWCNGAARSKKHRKPQGLELAEASDDSASEEDDDEDHAEGETKSKPYKPAEDLLAICEECSFAFCSRCTQSWHGEFVRCTPRREKGELTTEELASLEYMKMHTTPCPTCAAPAQKTHGCNHMICYRCQSHFCYLCSAWLDPGNPYQHFNEAPDGRVTGCYMRLWELEMGDGDDVGYGFAGGAGGQVAAHAVPPAAGALPQELIPEIIEPEEEEEAQDARHAAAAQPHEPQADGGQVGIAREGPLVLRIAAHQAAGAGRGGPRARAGAAAPGAVRGGARAARNNQAVGRGGGPQQQAGRGAGGGAQRGGQRGRGGRGGGPPHRQNANNPANPAERAQRRNANNNGRNQEQAGGPAAAAVDPDDPGDGELDPVHEAWVRHFVQLALNDEEDILLEEDSDDDDGDLQAYGRWA
ncbi:RWD-domain-containing protein [Trichocladium antarcticum]|uniref:RBR-type E3 ubiquitin transferase n=1 Tax=Trichocladium antarcticum TaxID=1450529 RepID=A0AAN6URS6_9PEZI|nr:RWD-domain-containing protein [Trichocladium antarcticum]